MPTCYNTVQDVDKSECPAITRARLIELSCRAWHKCNMAVIAVEVWQVVVVLLRTLRFVCTNEYDPTNDATPCNNKKLNQ